MNKKAIAILGAIFLLIVGTLGFLIYSKYSANKTGTTTQTPVTPTATTTDISNNNPNPPVDPNNNPATTTPISANNSGGVVKLTSDQVVSPALFFDGSGVTYFDNLGNLYQTGIQNSNGQLTLVAKKKLDIPAKQNITKILWPFRGSDFIAQTTSSDGKKGWSYFNSTTQLYSDLPSQVTSLDWMPNGNQIMYNWLDNNKTTLNLSGPDTKNWKFIADMWENDDAIIISPDGSQILYYETDSAAANNPINSVTSDGKIWKGLVKNGQNYGALWSPDGQKFLFAKKDLNSQKYQLWIYNLTSGEVKNLGLFTMVDKAVWDKDSNVIYVSVPNSGTPGGNSLTQDSFFKMNTTTLEKKQYNSGSSSIDGRDLFLNSSGDKLFFRNAQDGGLYYLDLNQQ